MFFRQYYLGCLSHASYLIGDTTTGRAVVVDPQRDVAEYLADAEAHGLTITHVLETHFHADFLSGHLELAAHTGATIGYGSAAEGRAELPITTYAHGAVIDLGEVALAFCATSAKADQGAINDLLDRHGPAGFAAAWLSHRNLGWAADLVRTPSSASHPEQIP